MYSIIRLKMFIFFSISQKKKVVFFSFPYQKVLCYSEFYVIISSTLLITIPFSEKQDNNFPPFTIKGKFRDNCVLGI